MSYEEIFQKLGENPVELSKEAVRLLIKIAENILSHPNNVKLRTLQKSNATIAKKILPIKGSIHCLKFMGFEEDESSFTLPKNIPLCKVEEAKDILLMWKDSIEVSDTNTDKDTNKLIIASSSSSTNSIHSTQNLEEIQPLIKPVVLPPLVSLFTNPFLHRVETLFNNCLQYENKDLQARAKSLVPLPTLEEGAQKRLRIIQEHIKKNKLDDPEISIQDTLILELLQWFKEDFFSWVDSPDCTYCNGKTHFSHMSTDSHLLVYTNRVELHRCDLCHKFTPFPRYNDLNILLETRRGRCGEWANTFTLFCRAMGWDTRYVMDEGDHVWTEVFSVAQKRWLHCDSCENICDKPLVYETGWKKKLTYVMAYSGEEVQDVTWRYTSQQKEVLLRRKNCTEKELVNALVKLRSVRQEKLSEPRKKYLTNRLLMELVELMVEKKPGDDENQSRQSGDIAWKLVRGEVQEENSPVNHVWKINTEEVTNVVTIRYSASHDKYDCVSGGKVREVIKTWNSGAFSHTNILRKEETDWKQVYLARKEGTTKGTLWWKFEIKGDSKTLDTVVVNFFDATFENGHVQTQICSGDIFQVVPNDVKMLTTNNFCGKKTITVMTTLSGGKGDTAWQHAQLFRQPTNSEEFPFTISFIFK